jgi:hypothetical protein
MPAAVSQQLPARLAIPAAPALAAAARLTGAAACLAAAGRELGRISPAAADLAGTR